MISWLPSMVVFTMLGQPVPIVQNSTGWCSPNIANVNGSVSVTCIGVSPEALKQLNQELNITKLHLEDRIRRANEWAARYRELEARLSEDANDSTLSSQAAEYLRNGNLLKAGAILDQLLQKEKANLDRYSTNEYNRALVYLLQFKPALAIPHLQRAYKYSSGRFEIEVGLKYSEVLLDQNEYLQAENILETVREALASAADVSSEIARADQAKISNALGIIYFQTQRFDKAEHSFMSAVQIRSTLASEDPKNYTASLISTLGNLGNLYALTDRQDEALDAFNRAFAICQPHVEAEPATYLPELARLLNNIAQLKNQMMLTNEAEADYREALRITQTLAVKDEATFVPEVASVKHNLAALYFQSGRAGDAVEPYRDAVTTFRRLASSNPGGYNFSLAEALTDLAISLTNMKQYVEAEVNYNEALEILRTLSSKDPAAFILHVAEVLTDIGILYSETNRIEAARNAYNEALSIYRHLSDNEPRVYLGHVAGVLTNLGLLDATNGRNAESESEYLESISTLNKLMVPKNTSYLQRLALVLSDLASLYANTQRADKAEATYKRVLEIHQSLAVQKGNAQFLNVSAALNDLGLFYASESRFSDARRQFEAALNELDAFRGTKFQALNEAAASEHANLAYAFLSEEEPSKARPHARQAVVMFRELWSLNHALFGDRLANSLLIEVKVEAELAHLASEVCAAAREASAVAVGPDYKENAAISVSSFCPPSGSDAVPVPHSSVDFQ